MVGGPTSLRYQDQRARNLQKEVCDSCIWRNIFTLPWAAVGTMLDMATAQKPQSLGIPGKNRIGILLGWSNTWGGGWESRHNFPERRFAARQKRKVVSNIFKCCLIHRSRLHDNILLIQLSWMKPRGCFSNFSEHKGWRKPEYLDDKAMIENFSGTPSHPTPKKNSCEKSPVLRPRYGIWLLDRTLWSYPPTHM